MVCWTDTQQDVGHLNFDKLSEVIEHVRFIVVSKWSKKYQRLHKQSLRAIPML